MTKRKVKITTVCLAAAMAVLAVFAVYAGMGQRVKAFAALPSAYTLNGAELSIASSKVDPWAIADHEGSMTSLTFSYGTDDAVFTTAWLYPQTPVREGFTEYAFEWKGGAYVLKERAVGGGLYIPVNGLVVSLKDDNAAWAAAQAGATLGKNGTFPDYIGAVDMVTASGSGNAQDKKIRIPLTKMNGTRKENEIVYYNAEWGPTTGQNEFGTEALFALQDDGTFEITQMRAVRDTAELQLNARAFIISIHGTYRALLTPDNFVKTGDKASLEKMQFVNLTKSNSRKITVSNPTKPVRDTDVDLITDASGKTPFPGFRAENYLIYYDQNYDKSLCSASANFSNFTGCNEWGYEVLVRRTSKAGEYPVTGVIESHGKQVDALLDEPSFILSGNGAAETFLLNSALNGAQVSMTEEGNVTITTTPASYVTTAVTRLETVNEMMQTAVDAKYKLGYIGEGDTAENNKWTRANKTAQDALGTPEDAAGKATLYGLMKQLQADEAQGVINNVHLADFYDLYLKIMNESERIEAMTYQGNAIMSIAAWHRPVAAREKTTEAIRETLQLFRSVNMNTVYVETFWNGYSMSDNSKYVDYHIDFANNTYDGYKDYLDAFIGEAHKLGMEVHAWVEDFFVGYEGYKESNVLTGKKPNSDEQLVFKAERDKWVIRDYQNNEYTQFEGGKYKFIDPSNPEVRKFLIDYYTELFTEYDLDGINLDYIRYPVQNFYGYDKNNPDVPFDHGYSEFSAAKFLKEQGVADKNCTLSYLKRQLSKKTSFDAEKTAKAWSEFKIRQINEFVAEVKTAVDALEAHRAQAAEGTYSENNIIISTSVFPDTDVKEKKSQDWFSWVQNGLIEVTTPMAYYTNANTVEQRILSMVNRIGGVSFNYGGIAPYFMGLSAYDEVKQALSALRGGAFGTVIFDSKTIMNSALAREYLSSGVYGGNAIVPHKRVDKLLSAFAAEMQSRADLYGITGEKLTAYTAALNELKAMPFATPAEIQEIMSAAYRLQTGARNYATGHAVTRIAEEMANLIKVLDVHLSRCYIDTQGWVPAQSPRPDRVTPPDPEKPDPQPPAETQKPKKGCGCGAAASAAVSGGAAIVLLAGATLLLRRTKKHSL
ncbi:MAG: family 10 glycosylhydrolase [Clostridia bacterium]|nr:family 10 glycosylhydrolase [Clostridia bacterium]